jgi:hypothetical protein
MRQNWFPGALIFSLLSILLAPIARADPSSDLLNELAKKAGESNKITKTQDEDFGNRVLGFVEAHTEFTSLEDQANAVELLDMELKLAAAEQGLKSVGPLAAPALHQMLLGAAAMRNDSFVKMAAGDPDAAPAHIMANDMIRLATAALSVFGEDAAAGLEPYIKIAEEKKNLGVARELRDYADAIRSDRTRRDIERRALVLERTPADKRPPSLGPFQIAPAAPVVADATPASPKPAADKGATSKPFELPQDVPMLPVKPAMAAMPAQRDQAYYFSGPWKLDSGRTQQELQSLLTQFCTAAKQFGGSPSSPTASHMQPLVLAERHDSFIASIVEKTERASLAAAMKEDPKAIKTWIGQQILCQALLTGAELATRFPNADLSALEQIDPKLNALVSQLKTPALQRLFISSFCITATALGWFPDETKQAAAAMTTPAIRSLPAVMEILNQPTAIYPAYAKMVNLPPKAPRQGAARTLDELLAAKADVSRLYFAASSVVDKAQYAELSRLLSWALILEKMYPGEELPDDDQKALGYLEKMNARHKLREGKTDSAMVLASSLLTVELLAIETEIRKRDPSKADHDFDEWIFAYNKLYDMWVRTPGEYNELIAVMVDAGNSYTHIYLVHVDGFFNLLYSPAMANRSQNGDLFMRLIARRAVDTRLDK